MKSVVYAHTCNFEVMHVLLQFCTQRNGTEIICKTPDLTNTSIRSFVEIIVLFDGDDFYWKDQYHNEPFHLRVFEDPLIDILDISLSSDVLQDKRFLELKVNFFGII